MLRFMKAGVGKTNAVEIKKIKSSANGYIKYFNRLRSITNRNHRRFQYLHKMGKGIAICYDTDVILGWILGDIEGKLSQLPDLPNLDRLVGPTVLSYLLNSSSKIYLPAGTIIEIDYHAARFARAANLYADELIYLTQSKITDYITRRDATHYKQCLHRSLRSFESATTQLGLLRSIISKSIPLAEILDPSESRLDAMRRVFDSAIQFLSIRRPGKDVNNQCDALNFAEVSTWHEGAKQPTRVPYLVTTTSAVLELSNHTDLTGSNEYHDCSVRPDEMSLFFEIASRFGWPNEQARAFWLGAYKSERLLRSVQRLIDVSTQLKGECNRLLEETSEHRIKWASAEIKCSLDVIQTLYKEFSTECQPSSKHSNDGNAEISISSHKDRELRDKLMWSEKFRRILSNIDNETLSPFQVQSFLDGIDGQLKKDNEDFEARSGLFSLQSLFENKQFQVSRGSRPKGDFTSTKPSIFQWARVYDLTLRFQDIYVTDNKSLTLSEIIRSNWDECLRLACTLKVDPSPLFLIDVRRFTEDREIKWVVDITFSPKSAPSEVWEIESSLFRFQLNTDTLATEGNTIVSERAFKGEWLYEAEYSINKSRFENAVFTEWGKLCDTEGELLSRNNEVAESIHYADVTTASFTFYIQTFSSYREEYKAGLILTAPIQPRQLSQIAKLLNRVNRYELTEKLYEDLLGQVIGSLPVF